MKLVMTLLVRDEEDIIDWNIRYHMSRGVERFIVTDNRSMDETAEILRKYERVGVLTYIYEETDDYSQDLWVSRMARLAHDQFQPDWILHCDADEFWWPERFSDLASALATVPSEARAISVARHNFVGPAHSRDEPFFERMLFRQRVSVNALGDSLPPKIAHRCLVDPQLDPGNHGISDGPVRIYPADFDGVSIRHFPARTPAQFQNKIALGGAAIKRNSRLPTAVGTWRSMHTDLVEGRFESVHARHFVNPDDSGAGAALVEDRTFRDYLRSL